MLLQIDAYPLAWPVLGDDAPTAMAVDSSQQNSDRGLRPEGVVRVHRGPTNSAAQLGYSTSFQKESFFVIFPAVNSNRSHPLTRIFLPSRVVPVNSHSETPRSPQTK